MPIGTERRNGKQSHGDWQGRDLHKRCWVEEQREQERDDFQSPPKRVRRSNEAPRTAYGSESRRRMNQEEVDRRGQFAAAAPTCYKCGVPSHVVESKTPKNPNRLFYCCVNDGCSVSWLKWCDHNRAEPTPPTRHAPCTPERDRGAHGAAGSSAEPPAATLLELLEASRGGDLRALEACLGQEGGVEVINEQGLARGGSKPATALRYAAFHGHANVVSKLLGAGALPCLADDNEQDALALAKLGRGHPGACGPPAQRAATITTLEAAVAADEWELFDVTKRPELNGCVVSIVGLLPMEGKRVVREAEAQGGTCFKLSSEKVRRRLLQPGDGCLLIGLGEASLRGAKARVMAPLNERGRYEVRVSPDAPSAFAGHCIKIKREHAAPMKLGGVEARA